jgi:uncharacterized protein YyaL (SSP411 family)
MTNRIDRRQFLAGAATPLLAAHATEGPYRVAAREFLDTLIDRGSDRYGSRHAPVFCLSLDPETHSPAKAPDRVDWEYRRNFEHLYRDFGYYWKSHLHSSNLIYDQSTIRALYELTKVTGAAKYARAADRYLEFFLETMISQQTGMFGWGEHVFYNVFTDYIIGGAFTVRSVHRFAYEHELDRWTTIYDLTWPKSPEKTLAEIDAIFAYKIHDPVTFMNNRHSDFFAGRVTSDTLTFVKHSGLFAHAFALAYVKTGDAVQLGRAQKAADLFWRHRDPQTNLVRGCIQRVKEPVAAEELALLILFLLRAYQWHPDQMFLDRSVAYLKGYKKYFSAGEGRFRAQVGQDGVDRKPGAYAEYWEGPLRMAKSAALAYSLTGDNELLELADTIVGQVTPETRFSTILLRSLISDELEARACALSAAIDLYEATANTTYLKKAEELAGDSIKRFLYRGLFVSNMQLYPEGDKSARTRIYDARVAPGLLALNLIRLQQHADATARGTFKKLDRLDRIYD